MSTKTKVRVRQATLNDVPKLVKLNRKSYPRLAKENVVWGASHLESHLQIFPEGQMVAVVGSKIVGAVSTLVVDMSRDPLRQHTWAGITDSGYFTNHDPAGDTLYGGDVYVDPECRRMGVGAALYEARRKLCRKLNKRRILAGGRVVGYQKVSGTLTADEYVEKVARGELTDPVLSFQLSQGFELRGVLHNYLNDAASCNHASLIEWLNPDYKQRPQNTARKVRLACVQYMMRKVSSFDDFAQQVDYFVNVAADYSSDFVLLPEFYSVQLLSMTDAHTSLEGIRRLAKFEKPFVKLMSKLAQKYDVTIIAGSHPVKKGKKLYNVSHVCLPTGRVVGQPKIHITPNEQRCWGISGGDQLAVIDTPVAKIGVMICYDIEFPEAARYLADQGAEIIFVPFCTDNRQGYLRVRCCAQARAIENQVYVALAGNVGNLPDVANMDIQYGQAAVLTPSDFMFARDGIAAEADSNEEMLLICDLDLDDLTEAHHFGSVRPRIDRRPDLFKMTVNLPEQHRFVPGEGPLGDQPKVE